jgi:hypothetical protein
MPAKTSFIRTVRSAMHRCLWQILEITDGTTPTFLKNELAKPVEIDSRNMSLIVVFCSTKELPIIVASISVIIFMLEYCY